MAQPCSGPPTRYSSPMTAAFQLSCSSAPPLMMIQSLPGPAADSSSFVIVRMWTATKSCLQVPPICCAAALLLLIWLLLWPSTSSQSAPQCWPWRLCCWWSARTAQPPFLWSPWIPHSGDWKGFAVFYCGQKGWCSSGFVAALVTCEENVWFFFQWPQQWSEGPHRTTVARVVEDWIPCWWIHTLNLPASPDLFTTLKHPSNSLLVTCDDVISIKVQSKFLPCILTGLYVIDRN